MSLNKFSEARKGEFESYVQMKLTGTFTSPVTAQNSIADDSIFNIKPQLSNRKSLNVNAPTIKLNTHKLNEIDTPWNSSMPQIQPINGSSYTNSTYKPNFGYSTQRNRIKTKDMSAI